MVRTTNPRSRTGDGSPGDGRSGERSDDAGCPHPATAREALGIDGTNVYHRCDRCGSLVIVALGGGGDDGDV